jgi:hypothetical protein
MADITQSTGTGQFGDFPAVPSHDGQFLQYNIFGNLFEVTAKYRPPIMPIGRGAYGIVWYFLRFFLSFFFFFLLSWLGLIGFVICGG